MRMRFNKAEREAFTVGARIEWRNGGTWYPGEIVSPIVATGIDIWQSCGIRHLGKTTKTVHTGQYITGSPTSVRVPA